MKYISLLALLLVSFFSFADDKTVAEISKIEGPVRMMATTDIKKQKAQEGDQLKAGDIVITGPNGRAKLKMFDGSLIVLDPKSHITLNSKQEIKQNEGKSYYKIRKRNKNNKIRVVTNFVVIGVKGTSFVVSADENDKRITMNQGLVNVQSLDKEFELYRLNEEEEFSHFQKEMKDGFNTYQREFKKEFAEFVKSFDLSEGKSIAFDGNKTIESRNSQEIEAEIKHFESF